MLDAAEMRESVNDGNALERLLAATSERMQQVNSLILERTESHVEDVPELARYLIEAGGKRLRPMLTIAMAQMFGSPSGDEINFAAAVEFMHDATLLHDDVVDMSDMRRGQPAARTVWGNQASVLVGDFLLGQAFLMMVETGSLDALGKLARAAAIIAEGEVFQLSRAGKLDTTVADYEQIIHAKTATLFEASTVVGAMAGGADAAKLAPVGEYGIQLGRAFQLVDDVLDYGGTSGELGKNPGDDLREGKMTLPVILALQDADQAERSLLGKTLGDPDATDEDLAGVRQILNRYDCLGRTLAEALCAADSAKQALETLPENETRQLLADIADFCVERGG